MTELSPLAMALWSIFAFISGAVVKDDVTKGTYDIIGDGAYMLGEAGGDCCRYAGGMPLFLD